MATIEEAKNKFVNDMQESAQMDYWGNKVATLKRPDAHPLKGFFTKRGIEQIRVARACGISQGHASLVLNGFEKPSPELQERLEALRDAILESEKRGRR
jgi:hypothetical protein